MGNLNVRAVLDPVAVLEKKIRHTVGLRPVGVMLPVTMRSEDFDPPTVLDVPVTWGLTMGLIYDAETQ